MQHRCQGALAVTSRTGEDWAHSRARRMFRARVRLSMRRGEKVSQAAFGALLAARLGRAKDITAATVSRWESGDATPDLATLEAVAELCDIDPGWLAFGAQSQAPAPAPEPVLEPLDARPRTFEYLVNHQALVAMQFELDEANLASGFRQRESARHARAMKGLRGLSSSARIPGIATSARAPEAPSESTSPEGPEQVE